MKKVSAIRCEGYDYNKVLKALEISIANLGGLSKYINKGEKVLLKVNLLIKKRPEEACTTHPVFVEALSKILVDYGAQVLIGDSPGGPFNEKALQGIYKVTGMEEAAEKSGAKLNYNTSAIQMEIPQGKLLKKITATAMLGEVDKVISVSKLKTHGMMTFTGAVKNMFGIVPGIMKAEYHLNMPSHTDFADALLDICLCANPALSFMDAIVGMEGAGPSGGDPVAVNAVLASDSPYHLDKAACHIIGLDYTRVPTLAQSVSRGLCTKGLEDIEFSGDALSSFVMKNFKVPRTRESRIKSNRLSSLIQPRPVFHKEACIGCRVCLDNCPAKVITMEKGKPVVNLKNCIRCYCCQELCPQKAVSIHRPKLLDWLSRL